MGTTYDPPYESTMQCQNCFLTTPSSVRCWEYYARSECGGFDHQEFGGTTTWQGTHWTDEDLYIMETEGFPILCSGCASALWIPNQPPVYTEVVILRDYGDLIADGTIKRRASYDDEEWWTDPFAD